MHARQAEQTKQAVQAELLDIFQDLNSNESERRARAASRRRLAARRAIERHQELKALEDSIKDGWDDL